MNQKLVIFGASLVIAYGYHYLTQNKRMRHALQSSSQFSEINAARLENKPMLVSIEPPGCPWSEHAANQIAQVTPQFRDRYVFMEKVVNVISTNGKDPFDYLMAHCDVGLCLFNPASGAVKKLDGTISAENLRQEMTQFAQARANASGP